MSGKSEAVREQLEQLRDDVRTLIVVLKEDPKERARKERAWNLLYGGLSAVFTMASRRVAERVFWVLTGKTAPTKRSS